MSLLEHKTIKVYWWYFFRYSLSNLFSGIISTCCKDFAPVVPFFFLSECLSLSLHQHICVCLPTRPLWISPRQVMLVPVNPSCEDYAKRVNLPLPHFDHNQQKSREYLSVILVFFQVCKQFTEAGFMADADLDSGCLLNKKIRNAQLAQYNFILGENLLLP